MDTYEKIITGFYGIQYRISVRAHFDSYRRGALVYSCQLDCREKGKRKWTDIPDTLSMYEHRALSLDDRAEHRHANMLRFVTKEELYQAKIELWEQLKPTKF